MLRTGLITGDVLARLPSSVTYGEALGAETSFDFVITTEPKGPPLAAERVQQ